MVKLAFNSSNKKSTNFDYPKLVLGQDEKARIVCIDPEPDAVWVHQLRAPRIVNGELVMETKKTKQGTIEVPATDFIGKHQCFGNPEILMAKDQDPNNCPTCEAVHEFPDALESIAAVRRQAMHILRYKTKPGSTMVQIPFGAELLAWTFADKIYNTLTDIAEEHGDLRKKDLLLTCTSKQFQNVDIQIGGSCEWIADEERVAFVKSLIAENRADDLTPLIARKVARDMAADDVAKVRLRHAQAFGGAVHVPTGSQPEGSEAGVSANMDLDSLLGEEGPSTPPQENTSEEVPGAQDETPTAPAPAVEESAAPAEEEKKDGDVLDFDAFLKDL